MLRIGLQFGIIVVIIFGLLQLSQYSLITRHWALEIYLVLAAIVFIVLGSFLGKILKPPLSPPPTVSANIPKGTALPITKIDNTKINELGISKREYEVLQQIAKGLSNKEIATTLFISESTVKTHVSNLLSKIGAKRRTQAVRIAKEINIIS